MTQDKKQTRSANIFVSIRCSWSGEFKQVGATKLGMPGCPFCGSPAIELTAKQYDTNMLEYAELVAFVIGQEKALELINFNLWTREKSKVRCFQASEAVAAQMLYAQESFSDGKWDLSKLKARF